MPRNFRGAFTARFAANDLGTLSGLWTPSVNPLSFANPHPRAYGNFARVLVCWTRTSCVGV